jgi:hypothetical protein
MRRYLTIAVGLGLLLVALSVTSAGPALAQGPLKPVLALIINDRSQPVPVTVVDPLATVTCTATLAGIAFGEPFGRVIWSPPPSSFLCSDGVTTIDVSRIVFTPDVGVQSFPSLDLAHYRVTVVRTSNVQDILAISTDGSPEAAVIRPFRFDAGNTGLTARVAATSGITGVNVTIGGTLVLSGTPVH